MTRAVDQFRRYVVRPTLAQLLLYSPAAENLVVGTAAHESGLQAFDQWTGAGDVTLGPAYGFFQIEPATHDDLWTNFLAFRAQLADRVRQLLAPQPDKITQLVTNLSYATAICRLRYYRASDPLPPADDVDALAAYWKAHYNTPQGAGRPEQWAFHYRALCR